MSSKQIPHVKTAQHDPESATRAKVFTPAEAVLKILAIPRRPLPAEREWVYFLEAPTASPAVVKIGKTQELRARLVVIQGCSPVPLRLIGAISAPATTELILHEKWKALRYFGEWFFATKPLLDFIATLPAGEPLPPRLLEQWITETQMPLGKARSMRVCTESVTYGERNLHRRRSIPVV